jgi:hypothetical protein
MQAPAAGDDQVDVKKRQAILTPIRACERNKPTPQQEKMQMLVLREF